MQVVLSTIQIYIVTSLIYSTGKYRLDVLQFKTTVQADIS
jgi:hypothetical protein